MYEIITEEDIRDVTWAVIETFIIPDFDARNHNASGNWKREVGVRTEPNKGIVTGPRYTGALIEGRQPNKDQSPEAINHFVRWAGHYIFKAWLANKGKTGNPYQVAYNIAKSGTRIYQQGGSDFLKVLETEEVKNFIIDRIKHKATVRISNILVQDLKNAIK